MHVTIGRTLRRGSAIMPTVWSDLKHLSRCTRTELFVLSTRHKRAATNMDDATSDHSGSAREAAPPEIRMADRERRIGRRVDRAGTMKAWSSSPTNKIAGSVREARPPGALAPEMAEDEDLAGTTELARFGPVFSPSPKCLRTAPRPVSPGPEICRSGSSSRGRNPQSVRLEQKVPLGGQSPRSGGCNYLAVRCGECRRSRAVGSAAATPRLQC